MTNYIGPITIPRVSGFTVGPQGGRIYSIAGDFTTEADLRQLEELCMDANMGSALHEIPGGRNKAEDNTVNSLFTHYCSFDDPSIPDGWYLIRSPVKRQESDVVMWFFTLDLFLIAKSESEFGAGLSLEDMTTMTNDWSL